MSELLENCPFCGEAAKSWSAYGGPEYSRVGCAPCGVVFKEEKHAPTNLSFKDRELFLVAKWNKREVKEWIIESRR